MLTVDVLAVPLGIVAEADTDAELVPAHKVGPLGSHHGLTVGAGLGGGVHDSADLDTEEIETCQQEEHGHLFQRYSPGWKGHQRPRCPSHHQHHQQVHR